MPWRALPSSRSPRPASAANRSEMKSAVMLQWIQRSSRGPSEKTMRSRGASEPVCRSVCPKCAVMRLEMLDDHKGDVVVELAGADMVHQVAQDAVLDLLRRARGVTERTIAEALDPEQLV